jgi:hypothetical protein
VSSVPTPEPAEDPDPIVDPAAPVGPEPDTGVPIAAPPGEGHPPEPRRYPSTIGGAFYLCVLAVTIFGLWTVWRDDWRIGIKMIGGALVFAAVVRLLLRSQDAGMLAVRHRALDAVLLGGVGIALLLLAITIPNQPV